MYSREEEKIKNYSIYSVLVLALEIHTAKGVSRPIRNDNRLFHLSLLEEQLLEFSEFQLQSKLPIHVSSIKDVMRLERVEVALDGAWY